jgi:hypothetical protein
MVPTIPNVGNTGSTETVKLRSRRKIGATSINSMEALE